MTANKPRQLQWKNKMHVHEEPNVNTVHPLFSMVVYKWFGNRGFNKRATKKKKKALTLWSLTFFQ